MSSQKAGHPEGERDWGEWKERLRALGFHPSKRLGQNFLLDDNLLAAIVRDAKLPAGARVVEVGVGLGVLTAHLLASGAEVIAFEIDERLFEFTRERFEDVGGLELIHADVLAGKNKLAPECLAALPAEGPWHLVSNLPYSIAGPLLALFAELENAPQSLTVLVQREQADRLLARPGTSDWGSLSIRLQLAYEGQAARSVPAAAFWPRPAIESRLVRFEARTDALDLTVRRAVGDFARQLFLHRRQSLARVLGRVLGDKSAARTALEAAGVDSGRRAEQLSLEEFSTLFRRLENSSR